MVQSDDLSWVCDLVGRLRRLGAVDHSPAEFSCQQGA